MIIDAYNNASNLFDSDSDTSIATTTLIFYMEHVDEALECYTKDMDNFKAASSLLTSFINYLAYLLIIYYIIILKFKRSGRKFYQTYIN